ncbi:MAG TPA: PBP1A family penicillin-binding protein [Acidobacteriota bacterium]|nr:PBP1A family penicillin-binding protein [Acidobacteriota bacterium]
MASHSDRPSLDNILNRLPNRSVAGLTPEEQRRRRRRHTLWILIPALCAALIGWIGATLWRYSSELPPIEAVYNIKPRLLTRLYDRYDQPFYEFYTERRVLTPISQMPPHLVRALLATEDRQFYAHWGVRWTAIVRGVIIQPLRGKRAQGGSTITQQLARSLFLTRERTVARKIKEWLMALKLERTYAKDEILEMYLNHNYYGAGAYGIQAAAQTYFGKDAGELNLAESAVLIGLLPAPTRFSPRRNPDLTRVRRDVVFGSLLAVGDIDQATHDSLVACDIELNEPLKPRQTGDYFAEEIRRYIERTYGEEAVYADGWSVYTTIDTALQRVAEESVRYRLDSLRAVANARYADNDPVYTIPVLDTLTGNTIRVRKKLQAAVMAMDNETGGVLAMVGGYDFGETQLNRVTQSRRQPGSAFKPFVLTAAVEAGIKPSDTIYDSPIVMSIPGVEDEWAPRNFDLEFKGPITIRQGYYESRNLVAIKLLLKLDPRRAAFYAEKMGITTPLNPVPSLAIGSSEVTLYDMTAAYSVFPNGGIRTRPVMIRKIVDRFGRVIEDNTALRREEVLSAPQAYMVLHVLKSVVDEGTGTGRGIRRRGFTRPAAGKTGTTNEYMDNWFMGFTPQITCGTWVGYDLKTPIGGYHTGTGAATALPIWAEVMNFACRDLPPLEFEVPDGIILSYVCRESNERACDECPSIREEVYLNAADTIPICPIHDPLAKQRKPKRIRL